MNEKAMVAVGISVAIIAVVKCYAIDNVHHRQLRSCERRQETACRYDAPADVFGRRRLVSRISGIV
jgi:hypothetical protein